MRPPQTSHKQPQKMITQALTYARSFIGAPYRWHRADDPIEADDKFWVSNETLTITLEEIERAGKSIVCTGLANLVRRHLGLTIPGLGSDPHPGTTGAWFSYLTAAGRLEPLDVRTHYPAGTLLLRDFADIETDQGHVAILAEAPAGQPILAATLLHAYADRSYEESAGAAPAGTTGLTPFSESYGYASEKGYYTHICRPENWILRD